MNARNICLIAILLLHVNVYADLPQELGVLRDSLENLSKVLSQPAKGPIKPQPSVFKYATFKAWNDACVQYFPSYQDRYSSDDKIRSAAKKKYFENKPKVLPSDELIKAITAFRDLIKSEAQNVTQWLDGKMPAQLFPPDMTKADRNNIIFEPFVMRHVFDPGSKFAIHGDWHGDVHSLLYLIREMQRLGYMKKDSFEIVDPQFNFLFLGDAVDRGLYSLETIYTLIRLTIANPGNVYIMRGNHDDWSYARAQELGDEVNDSMAKGQEHNTDLLKNALLNWFNLLPSALYMATKDAGVLHYIQCCHGGIEVGYDPKAFLASNTQYQHLTNYITDRAKNVAAMGLNVIKDISKDVLQKLLDKKNKDLGLAWSDFAPDQKVVLLEDEDTLRFEFGKAPTEAYNTFASTPQIRFEGFFRAHQHGTARSGTMMNEILNNPAAPGIAKLWQKRTPANKNIVWPNIVCTFNIAPNTGIGEKNNYFKDHGRTKGVAKDFWGLLTVQSRFDAWTLEAKEINQV